MRLIDVLIVEDDLAKRQEICSEVSAFFGDEVRIETCDTFGLATRRILGRRYDLITVDLLLPRRNGADPTDVSEELLEHIRDSKMNRLTTIVAISQFDDIVSRYQNEFTQSGIFLISYNDDVGWRSCLRVCMQKASFRTEYDFVVICAIEEERSAFEAVNSPDFRYGELKTVSGLDTREIRIGEQRGACVLQPRMGLVEASIVSSRALEAFTPRLICMSGICGGFASQIELGALLISDVCWEHQAGKWKGTGFEMRHFQERIGNRQRTILNQMVEEDPCLQSLASKAGQIELPHVRARIAPSVTGSAVIASTDYSEQIKSQHGKVAGIDMEVFGLYRAVALHGSDVACFAAKTVVDLADEGKSDALHREGAILSARFTVEAIKRLIED